MILSSTEINLLNQSLPWVKRQILTITTEFYKNLFEAYPNWLESIFNKENFKTNLQAKNLASSIISYAELVIKGRQKSSNSRNNYGFLHQIAFKHFSIGITSSQYKIIHNYLFATARKFIAPTKINKKYYQVWEQLYWNLAGELINLESNLYLQAGVKPGEVFFPVKIVEKQYKGNNQEIVTLTLTGIEKKLPRFNPGQYISLKVNLGKNSSQLRQYSLHATPLNDYWRISVKKQLLDKKNNQGEVSNYIHQKLNIGDIVEVSYPSGNLYFPSYPTSPLIIFSEGTGITPFIAIIKSFTNNILTPPYLLGWVHFHNNSDPNNPLVEEAKNEFTSLKTPAESFFLIVKDTNISELKVLNQSLNSKTNYIISGSKMFIENIKNQLIKLKIPETNIRYETYMA